MSSMGVLGGLDIQGQGSEIEAGALFRDSN